ncbi:hypothetical protein [Mycobacterium vicinigordonae]|uniref:PE-PGRS family protein n=1 Tax=Mycobacterium vicinigordonae TaxID=1719132 RepID=A0A7D6HXZ9_9MYCO|nr:hypothetical protein [Mycobacterium vicinigordonae]QLL05454.1 hypothetical protein H0P51_16465 [Mycobacterium vicinigordonae]
MTKRCNRALAVAVADASPAAAPAAVAATACAATGVPDGDGVWGEVGCWRTTAGWPVPDCPDAGVTGAEAGVPDTGGGGLGGAGGVMAVETEGRRSAPYDGSAPTDWEATAGATGGAAANIWGVGGGASVAGA